MERREVFRCRMSRRAHAGLAVVARGGVLAMLLGGGALVYEPVAYGGHNADGNPTFDLDFTFGLSSTYKSKYVNMNDTGTDTMYSLGGNAGQDKNLGFMVRSDTQTTTFKINNSKIASVWQDSILRYAIGPVYLGVNFSQISLLATQDGTKTIDAVGSGTGGNLGVNYDFEKSGLFYLDVTTATLSAVRNSLDLKVKGGSRTDIDLGLGYHITKENFIFLLGYKQRTFTMSADTSYAEAMMTTYIGLRTALYF